jgi:hypothetical protein
MTCIFRPLDSREPHASLGLGMRTVLYNAVSGPTRPLASKLAPGAHAQNPSIAANYHHSPESLILVAARQSRPDLVVLRDKFFLESQPLLQRKTHAEIAKRPDGTAKNLSERRKSTTERDTVRKPMTVFSESSGRRSRKPTSKIQYPTSARRRRRAIMTVDPKQHKSSYIRTRIRCLLFK